MDAGEFIFPDNLQLQNTKKLTNTHKNKTPKACSLQFSLKILFSILPLRHKNSRKIFQTIL